MGKKIDKLKEKDIGAIGIGAMIVFIAMVLVAGIAASVLIQTSGKLETQAMKTGSETIQEVATGVQVDGVLGWVTSSAVRLVAIEIRPRAGSTDVDLSETVIELSDSTSKNLFTYNLTAYTDTDDINGNIFTQGFYPWRNASRFGVIVLEDADDSISSATNPVINTGDHVLITLDVGAAFGTAYSGIATRKNIFGQIIPEEGSPGVISFTTPAAYNDVVVELQ